MKRYEKGLMIVIILILVLSMFAGCTVSVNEREENANQKNEKVLGYAIILHHDGEEHIEFTEYSCNSAKGGIITIRDINGRLIKSNNITLIFY